MRRYPTILLAFLILTCSRCLPAAGNDDSIVVANYLRITMYNLVASGNVTAFIEGAPKPSRCEIVCTDQRRVKSYTVALTPSESHYFFDAFARFVEPLSQTNLRTVVVPANLDTGIPFLKVQGHLYFPERGYGREVNVRTHWSLGGRIPEFYGWLFKDSIFAAALLEVPVDSQDVVPKYFLKYAHSVWAQ